MANPSKIQAEIVSVRPYGKDVFEVRMKPQGRVPRFKAGQFLHLTIDNYDPSGGFWPESRVFSIASRYGADEIVIVYSVKGVYTKRMKEFLAPGKSIWLKLPYGDFVLSPETIQNDVVLVAGGSGVSPFVPFLENLADGAEFPQKVQLFYGVREPEMSMFTSL
jgi:NAD(P)H-flavin reductase